MRALVEAGIAVTSELSLDAVLAEARRDGRGADRRPLRGARRHRRAGDELERFLTAGIDARDARGDRRPAARAAASSASLIRDARAAPAARPDRAIRARSASRRTTRRCRRFLGVPILLRGVAYGNLYLTEKEGGEDFTEEDEELVDAARRAGGRRDRERAPLRVGDALAAQLESLNEIGNALVGEIELAALLAARSPTGCAS